MSNRCDVNPLVQIQQAAAACGLKMEPSSLPRRMPTPINKGLGRITTFDAAADFFWLVAGDPQNVKAFLALIGGTIGSYFAFRASKSITVKTGGIEIKLTGTNDYPRAIAAVKALQDSAAKDDGKS